MIYRPLGKTGFNTSALGLGGESAIYKRGRPAAKIIEKAIDLGVNYFDTAPTYDESELNFGDVLPQVRDRVFIATKVEERGYDGAWRQLEASLKRLRTDHIDLWQIHHLDRPDEIDEIFEDDGVVRAVQEAKEQGLTRFVGVSGHTDPEVLETAIERYTFDTILMALNPAEVHVHSFQESLLPVAVSKDMGIMAMKVLARGLIMEHLGWNAVLPIHYVLSLAVSNVVLGVMNEEQLVRDAEIVNEFSRLGPMPEEDMRRLEQDSSSYANELTFFRKGNENFPFPYPPNMVRKAF